MATITDRTIHLTRIGYALATAKEAFLRSYDMEDDQKAIKALVVEFGRNIRGLVDVCTDDFHDPKADAYLDGIENAINDCVDNEFSDAITARDQAAEDSRDPYLRAGADADRRHDERRDHEAMGWVA